MANFLCCVIFIDLGNGEIGFVNLVRNRKHLSTNPDDILNIRHTKDTQTFRKPYFSSDPAHLQGGLKETSCDFPTLLHFSAHHGLERLTSVLLECPGAVLANQMKNCSDMTPAELSE